jgi:hypothetical protein
MGRFRCVADQGGTWEVWDEAAGEPATLDGKRLTDMSQPRAEAARNMLEQIAQAASDPTSFRAWF